MKNPIAITLTLMSLIVLTGCSAIADLQMKKERLADGSTVYVNSNIIPTPNWGCREVARPQSYDWGSIKRRGQFSLSGPQGLLRKKALAYANQQRLKVNYINLQVPEGKTFSVSRGRSTSYYNLNRSARAYAMFYQCQKINPDKKLSVHKSTNIGVGIGTDVSMTPAP